MSQLKDNSEIFETPKNAFNRSKTTIEKVFSPIGSPKHNYQDIDYDPFSLSSGDGHFNDNTPMNVKVQRKRQMKRMIKSTPKSRVKLMKKFRNDNLSVSLWDRATNKNPELDNWIKSFNDEMEKVENTQLSMSDQSIHFEPNHMKNM